RASAPRATSRRQRLRGRPPRRRADARSDREPPAATPSHARRMISCRRRYRQRRTCAPVRRVVSGILMGQRRIHPVVLCGGSGTRLWPLSRALYPKQLLALASERTLLQDTILRPTAPGLFAHPIVVGNGEHRFLLAEQLREMGIEPDALIVEPVGRNTAPAAAVAALLLSRDSPDAHMLV